MSTVIASLGGASQSQQSLSARLFVEGAEVVGI